MVLYHVLLKISTTSHLSCARNSAQLLLSTSTLGYLRVSLYSGIVWHHKCVYRIISTVTLF
jgi:hypothetical protein